MIDGLHVDVAGRAGAFEVKAAFSSGAGITALFGPSGSGKTTLLRMIAGLHKPASGSIRDGKQVYFDSSRKMNMPPHLRRVGYVFQDSRLFPHMSVERNLTYAAPARTPDGRRRFSSIVDLMGIGSLLDRFPATLSGGEKQRVAIGRALLSQPSLLLLDEPLASLDIQRRREILPYIESLRDHAGMPIVFVSHDIGDVARLADRVVLLSQGAVVAEGRATDMFARQELAALVGDEETGTLLEGVVSHVDSAYGVVQVDIGGQSVEVVFPGSGQGTRIRMRVKARDVGIARNAVPGISIRNQLSVEILGIAVSDGTHADLLLLAGPQKLVSRISRKSLDELRLKQGDRVFALLKAIAVERHALTGAAT